MRGSNKITDQEIRYAALVASGEQSITSAYREVWPERCNCNDGAVRTKAYNMLKRPAVKAELERLRGDARAKAVITRDEIIDRYKALLEQGDAVPVKTATQYAAVAAAKARILEALVKIYGYAEPAKLDADITITLAGCDDCAD